MKREDYYQPNESREDYHHNQYQNYQNSEQGPAENGYNNYQQSPQQPVQSQQPYYPPRRSHHVFLWVVVIILCLGLGWFAADHFMGGDTNQANEPTKVVTNKTVNKTTTQQPNVSKLEREMDQLDISTKDQQAAVTFYQKQSLKDQDKMNKMIDLVNKVVPSNTLKRQALSWILQ